MKIWKKPFTIERLNTMSTGTLGHQIGIQFTGFGDDYLEATMPVDQRTIQPMGLLHGGASAALAETLGSVGSYLCLPESGFAAVGVDLHATHLRPVLDGFVTGRATPIRIGKTVHVWDIHIKDQRDKLVCVSRLTVNVVKEQ